MDAAPVGATRAALPHQCHPRSDRMSNLQPRSSTANSMHWWTTYSTRNSTAAWTSPPRNYAASGPHDHSPALTIMAFPIKTLGRLSSAAGIYSHIVHGPESQARGLAAQVAELFTTAPRSHRDARPARTAASGARPRPRRRTLNVGATPGPGPHRRAPTSRTAAGFMLPTGRERQHRELKTRLVAKGFIRCRVLNIPRPPL